MNTESAVYFVTSEASYHFVINKLQEHGCKTGNFTFDPNDVGYIVVKNSNVVEVGADYHKESFRWAPFGLEEFKVNEKTEFSINGFKQREKYFSGSIFKFRHMGEDIIYVMLSNIGDNKMALITLDNACNRWIAPIEGAQQGVSAVDIRRWIGDPFEYIGQFSEVYGQPCAP